MQVGEQDRPNVTIGQQAMVWPDALAASPLAARVTAIAGLASSDFFDITRPVRQFDVTLTLDHPDPRLRPGTSVKVVLGGPPRRQRASGAASGRPAEERQTRRVRADRGWL